MKLRKFAHDLVIGCWSGFAVATTAVLVHVAAPAPSVRAEPPGERQTDAQVKAALERALPELGFDGVGLSEVIDFLRDVSSLNIHVDWDALEKAGVKKDAPVTAKLKNVKLSKTLTVILDSASKKPGVLTYAVKDGAIHIAPK